MSGAVDRWADDLSHPWRVASTSAASSAALLQDDPLLSLVLDAVDAAVVVLDGGGRVVRSNAAARELLGDVGALEQELAETLAAVGSGSREGECLVPVRRAGQIESVECRVRAAEIHLGGESFRVVSLRDVRREKRNMALGRAFFHDISNTAVVIGGFVGLLQGHVGLGEEVRRLVRLARRLSRQIDDQRALTLAEAGELTVRPALVAPGNALQAAVDVLAYLPGPVDRTLIVDGEAEPQTIMTDPVILDQVLVAMLRQALEATPEGGTVRAWVETAPGACEFRVWHDAERAPAARRPPPLATYAMKLFGERCLGGTIGCTTGPDGGTCCFLRLPTAADAKR